MNRNLTILFYFLFTSACFSQTVSLDPVIDPPIFTSEDEITITYDVTNTELSSLSEAWIWLWLPDESSYSVDTNINPASADPDVTNSAKFTKNTNDGRIVFSMTIRLSDFIETSEEYSSVGMLLKANDWSGGQTTDYINEVVNGFAIVFNNPSGDFSFYEKTEELSIDVSTSEISDIEILVDNVRIASELESSNLSVKHTIINDGELHEIKAIAITESEKDSIVHIYSIIEEVSVPENLIEGVNYLSNSSASLLLNAPNKNHVFLLGDFNNWEVSTDYLMNKDGNYFWYELTGLTDNEYRFQYYVDSEIRIADPYSEKVSSSADDPEIISSGKYPGLKNYPQETTQEISYIVTDKSPFEWTSFKRPEIDDLIIYELLVRDFTEERNFQAVIDSLDYLADLGINAIELMPIMEFEGNLSWGYNSYAMFSVDKYYGPEDQLKKLVEEAHKKGIAIILDIVLNHQFGRNSLVKLFNEGTYGNPTQENPWFNVSPKHDFNVGYDMNHESELTKKYVERVVNYWIDEYNIDGYRFDLSKGFTQKNSLGNIELWGSFDESRVAIWKNIADIVWKNDPGIYVILEHFADNQEEKELANYGMMLWGNMNDTYHRAARGNSVSLDWGYYKTRDWDTPNLISYMESHDEERQMFWLTEKDGLNTKEALKREMLAASFFLTVPGPKMIWQFGEFGYDVELNDDRLGIKPTKWEYLDDPDRLELFYLYKSLINLRTKTDFIDGDYFEWSTSGWIKTINITHPELDIYVIGNFNTETQTGIHNFTKSGTWYNYLTGSKVEVNELNEEITLSGGQFRIYTSEPLDNYLEEGLITSINNNEITIDLFPNPTTGNLFVEGNDRGNYIISVRDLSGKLLTYDLHTPNKIIDLSTFPSGIYLVEISNSFESITKKVIKK